MSPHHGGRAALFLALLLPAVFGRGLSAQSASLVTFTRDIAPVIWQHCSSCHRTGQLAPFSLLTYEDVRPRAREIVRAVKSHQMPPWKPEPGHGNFEGSRRLSDGQVALIERWVDQGSRRGDLKDLPPAPIWTAGWQLGQPDLIVSMPEPYQLPPRGTDVIRTFVMSIPLESRRYVRAVEFLPGNFKAVHHANIKIDETRGSRWLDEDEPGPGYEGGGGRHAKFPDGYFLGWTPGQLPRMSPDGMAWSIVPGSDLVVELHMVPGGAQQMVQTSVGLYFTDEAPVRLPYMLRLGRQDIDIRAGEKEHVVSDTFVLPVDVEAFAVQPHAHNLAKEVSGTATLPDGSTRRLIYIKTWDFNWQDVYRYVEPVSLPKGTTVVMRYTYDNSAGNVRNPNRPPARVTFGQTTSSEMGDLWIQVVPVDPNARAVLDRAYVPKMLVEDAAGYEKMLEVNPDDARAHHDLASCYLELDRMADALAHLESAVRLEPDSAWAHYDLGIVLLRQRRFDEAGQRFRRAANLKPDFSEAFSNLGVVYHAQGKSDEALIWYEHALRIKPDNAEAHYNLGRMRAAQGKDDEAAAHFLQALRIHPDDAEAHSGLGGLLASHGQLDEAVAHYRRALQLKPDLPGALIDLAWILATSARAEISSPNEAIHFAERGAELTGYRDATALDTLAVAYAASGRWDQAIKTAQAALDLASAGGDRKLAEQIRERLEKWPSR